LHEALGVGVGNKEDVAIPRQPSRYAQQFERGVDVARREAGVQWRSVYRGWYSRGGASRARTVAAFLPEGVRTGAKNEVFRWCVTGPRCSGVSRTSAPPLVHHPRYTSASPSARLPPNHFAFCTKQTEIGRKMWVQEVSSPIVKFQAQIAKFPQSLAPVLTAGIQAHTFVMLAHTFVTTIAALRVASLTASLNLLTLTVAARAEVTIVTAGQPIVTAGQPIVTAGLPYRGDLAYGCAKLLTVTT
jgi:hypothetical protein